VFGIERSARPRKRGLFRGKPDPREIASRLERMVRRMERDAVVRAGWKKTRFVVTLALHEAAPHGELVVHDDGELTIDIPTGAIGPGYHADVVERIDRVLDELEYAWVPAERDDFVDHRDLARLQRDACEALAGELRAGATRLGVRRRFRVDAPVATPLGPRDAAWRDAGLADPMRAADAFAHWERGPGCEERARALLALWTEVPWREPLDDAEREMMKQVDRELRAARKADRELDLPYAAWAELHELLGIDGELANAVRERAAAQPAPKVGYRRFDLDIELSGGWWITLPGAMVGHWEDNGERYWATDGDRAVEFTSVTAPDETDSARLLAVAPAHHPVIAELADDRRRGRAEAHDDGDLRIVYGFVAQAPHVAILTCKCGRADEPWALATWRSLHQEDDE